MLTEIVHVTLFRRIQMLLTFECCFYIEKNICLEYPLEFVVLILGFQYLVFLLRTNLKGVVHF